MSYYVLLVITLLNTQKHLTNIPKKNPLPEKYNTISFVIYNSLYVCPPWILNVEFHEWHPASRTGRS